MTEIMSVEIANRKQHSPTVPVTVYGKYSDFEMLTMTENGYMMPLFFDHIGRGMLRVRTIGGVVTEIKKGGRLVLDLRYTAMLEVGDAVDVANEHQKRSARLSDKRAMNRFKVVDDEENPGNKKVVPTRRYKRRKSKNN